MISLALIPICSVMNRARGSQFWNEIPSTVASRVLAMGVIASACAALTGNILILPVLWALLMLWCTSAWDSFWSAEIGNDPAHSKGWGCVMMFLRMLLIVPAFIALAYLVGEPQRLVWIFPALFYWLPYYAFGAINKGTVIPRSEYTVGALIGFTLAMILQ